MAKVSLSRPEKCLNVLNIIFVLIVILQLLRLVIRGRCNTLNIYYQYGHEKQGIPDVGSTNSNKKILDLRNSDLRTHFPLQYHLKKLIKTRVHFAN